MDVMKCKGKASVSLKQGVAELAREDGQAKKGEGWEGDYVQSGGASYKCKSSARYASSSGGMKPQLPNRLRSTSTSDVGRSGPAMQLNCS
jgi:hypothetical protein